MNRKNWIDVIKVFAAILIIVQHSVSTMWTDYQDGTVSWKILTAIFMLARCSVPLFVMCSGYGMMAKERSIKDVLMHILKLLIVYASWMIIYGIADCLVLLSNGEPTSSAFAAIPKAVGMGRYHVWYIFGLMGLYLMTPILWELMKNKKIFTYALIVSFTATFTIPLVQRMPTYNRFEYTLGSFDFTYLYGYIFYYLIGACLHVYKLEIRDNKVALIVGTVVMFILVYVMTVVASAREGEAVQTYFDDMRITGMILYILVFASLRFAFAGIKDNWLINTLAKVGFAVYMSHVLIINLADKIGLTGFFKALFVYIVAAFICIGVSHVPILRDFFISGKLRFMRKKEA